MTLLARLRFLLRNLFGGRRADRALEAELQSAVEIVAAEHQARGLTPEAARRAAMLELGGTAQMAERVRSVRLGHGLETIWADIRYGLRGLRRSPGFSVVAILTLTLGIGVSTALFSVIDAALVRPLPYPHPEELVRARVEVSDSRGRVSGRDPSITDIRDWRAAERVLSHAGMGRLNGSEAEIVETGDPERVEIQSGSEDFLEIFGVQPIYGRSFTIDDTKAASPEVALVGHGYWQTRFAADPNVVGRVVRIADKPVAIVGVLPEGFYGEVGLWRPKRFRSPGWELLRANGMQAYARLRPGITLTQAEEVLTALTKSASASRGDKSVRRVLLSPMYDEATRGYGQTISMLGYAVAFILLIACVNVAGLLLARGASREVELGVRASLGAGRGRLVRQLLTESVVLASAAALLGVFVSWLALDALVALIPLRLPPNSPPSINIRVLTSAAGAASVSALAFGLLPAIRLSRVRLGGYLAAAGRRHGPALSRRGGQALIAVEVALAVVLLAGAGLMVRSFERLLNEGMGFDPESVLTMEVEPVDPSAAVRDQYYTSLLGALRNFPEVAVAGALDHHTIEGGAYIQGMSVNTQRVNVSLRQVVPGYFEALGLSARLGRLPTEADRSSANRVVVVNEEAARQVFPDGSPIGRLLPARSKDAPTERVIGVVGNVRYRGPGNTTPAEIYRLAGQNDSGSGPAYDPLTVVMRLRPGTTVAFSRLRQVAQQIGPRVVVGKIASGSEWLDERTVTPKNRTLLLGLLGGLGLILTLVGIFSITAYAVARRTREIGVRIAFGARPSDVVGTMVRDAAWPMALGIVAGLVGAYFSTTVVASFLFKTTPHDPGTFAMVAMLMAATACLAAWVPARRAARIDPVEALRAE